jgi:hypothetical protein
MFKKWMGAALAVAGLALAGAGVAQAADPVPIGF